jgi:hypothetical protein
LIIDFHLSNSRATLHIFDHPNISILDKQIRDGNNSTFNGFKNYYLVHVPVDEATNTMEISEYFTNTQLKYNSLTFAFTLEDTNDGNKNVEEFSI